MKKKDRKILTRNKRKLATRLKRKNYSDQPQPMFQPGNLHYEMSAGYRHLENYGCVKNYCKKRKGKSQDTIGACFL